MRTILHIASFITLTVTIWILSRGFYSLLFVPLVWYIIGLWSAVSHIKWTRDHVQDHNPSRVWVFYTWYALSGIVLLVLTKGYETLQDLGNIR